MYLYQAKIGHHRIRFEVQTEHLKEWIAARFPEDRDELAALPVGSGEAAVEAAAGEASESEVVAALASTEAAGAKAVLYITDFYGSMYDEGPVEIEADGDTVVYSRKDYRMETSADYSSVKLQVFDDLALKHALINWYSAWLIHRREGCSCIAPASWTAARRGCSSGIAERANRRRPSCRRRGRFCRTRRRCCCWMRTAA